MCEANSAKQSKVCFQHDVNYLRGAFALPGMICCCFDEVCQQTVHQDLSEPHHSAFLGSSVRQRGAIRLSLSLSSFLQSLNLMSICSRAVDALLMSENLFVLIIRYREDFKVGSLDRFSVGWSGRRAPRWVAAVKEDVLLKCQIKPALTREGRSHEGQEVVLNFVHRLAQVW